MISRGKSRNVDEHITDLINSSGDQFYSEFKDDMFCFSAGKLGQKKYEGEQFVAQLNMHTVRME